MPFVTLDSVVRASPQQVAAVLGDEVVILGIDEGAYFALRAVGARIWELFRAPIRLRDVVDCIVEEFDVERERCEQDLIAFTGALISRRLIEVIPDA